MTDAVVSRLGQVNATGAVDALFYKKFSGEILTRYEHVKKLKPLVRVRQISEGKSAGFNATYRVRTRYHQAGTEILGQKIKHQEVVVTLDDLLIADTFVAKIDELKNHYDVRAPYANELGDALALFEDRTIAQCIVKAARGAELFVGDGGGSSVQESDIGMSADFDASGSDLISALNKGKQNLDERRVPVDTMTVNALLLPAQWYLIANSDKNLNTQTGGQGASVAHQVLRTVSDIVIQKSNAPLFGYDVTPYNASTNPNGIVMSATDTYADTLVSIEDALPNDYPTKYQLDLVNTVGTVWVEPAVAYLQLLGLNMDFPWDARRRGTLMIAEMAIGMDALRTKCAVEIKRTP